MAIRISRDAGAEAIVAFKTDGIALFIITNTGRT